MVFWQKLRLGNVNTLGWVEELGFFFLHVICAIVLATEGGEGQRLGRSRGMKSSIHWFYCGLTVSCPSWVSRTPCWYLWCLCYLMCQHWYHRQTCLVWFPPPFFHSETYFLLTLFILCQCVNLTAALQRYWIWIAHPKQTDPVSS